VKGSRDLLLRFRDPSISREQLKLETSNFAHRLTTGGLNEKNAKLGQKGPEGVTWPTFRILGPLHISGSAEARNFKFGMQIGHGGELNEIMLN